MDHIIIGEIDISSEGTGTSVKSLNYKSSILRHSFTPGCISPIFRVKPTNE